MLFYSISCQFSIAKINNYHYIIFRHQSAQSSNPSLLWKLPDTNGLMNIANPNEVLVGGVYLRIFVTNPSWTLRKPKEFLMELLETCLSVMGKEKPNVSTIQSDLK